MDKKLVTIIGCGPGARKYLTLAAIDAAEAADVLIGPARLLEMFPTHAHKSLLTGGHRAGAIAAIEAHTGKRVALLVTGDVGVASLAECVVEHFGREACELIPGISSVQLAYAKLGLVWEQARIVNAHASTPAQDFARYAQEQSIAVLTAGDESLQWTAALAQSLGAQWSMHVAEDLGGDGERVYQSQPEALIHARTPVRAVVILQRRSQA